MKWLGAVLMMFSAGLFVAAGAEEAAIMVPAGIMGISGLWCWDRGGRSQSRREAQRLDTGMADRMRAMEERLNAMQDQVSAHHVELFELRDQRDFFTQLYGTTPTRTQSVPKQTL
jgi:hypothetical protein